MNILLVNHYAGSPVLGMEFRPYYLGREWVRSGNKVMIVGGSYSHLRKQQPTSDAETIEGIEYRWIPLKPYKGNGLGRIRSMFDFVRKLRFSYKKFLGDFKPDVVIASSTYPLDIYPCKHIADHYKAKLVYEVHDLWPLSPMELGGYSKYHPFIMVMQAAEDYCYRHANKVVSLLPAALPHMVERGMDPEKFAYVPNGFDPQEWQSDTKLPEQHSSMLRDLKNEGRFIILYVGGHAISNALDTLLDAAKLIKNPAVAIILVGNGQEKERLIRRCSDEKIANVYFLPPVEKQAVPALLSEADALYIGWEANLLYRFGISPNKLVDYMVSAKPIIHSVTAANNPVKESGCGISVAAGDINGVKEAIEDMSTATPDILAEMGRKGHEFATEHWDYQKLSKSFIFTPPQL